MKKIVTLFLLFCVAVHSYTDALQEKLLVVVVPSYNNAAWYQKNLASIFMQKYTNYKLIYIDDCSTDGTADLVEAYIAKEHQNGRCTVIRNTEHKGHLYNHLHARLLAEDHAIIINIDGDDWLRLDEYMRDDIFQMINCIYDDPNVWLTYGSYYRYPYGNLGTCKLFPQEIVDDVLYRQYPWVSSHLRTYYAWLFKQVKLKDLYYDGPDKTLQGKLWPSAADLSIMFPMLEMANGRFFYVEDVIYAYNRANPLNLCEGNRLAVQNHCAELIRAKESYAPLDESVFWNYMKPWRA